MEGCSSDDAVIPMMSFYKPGEAGIAEQPLDNFQDRTHVSVYPRGLPTEDVFAKRTDSKVRMKHQTIQANDLLLQTGQAWGSEFTFTVLPDAWGPSGFVWARNKLNTLLITCKHGREVLSEKDCDPLFGDEPIYDADMNVEDRRLLKPCFVHLRLSDRNMDQ